MIMKNTIQLSTGRILLALALFLIGAVHIIFGAFPAGPEPVPNNLPGVTVLAYITGITMMVASVAVMIKNYRQPGIQAIGIIYTLILLLVQTPKVLINIKNPSTWTTFFEVLALLGGILILAGLEKRSTRFSLVKIGRWSLILSLLVFGVLHVMYASFIVTLIPGWLPLRSFFGTVVMLGFFGAAVSFIIQKATSLSSFLLSGMFMIWFIILHIPRAIIGYQKEAEWTSAFIALSMSGISLLAGASFTKTAGDSSADAQTI